VASEHFEEYWLSFAGRISISVLGVYRLEPVRVVGDRQAKSKAAKVVFV